MKLPLFNKHEAVIGLMLVGVVMLILVGIVVFLW